MSAAKIRAVDDESDVDLLITQRFRRQIREKEFEFRFAHHGEEALAGSGAPAYGIIPAGWGRVFGSRLGAAFGRS